MSLLWAVATGFTKFYQPEKSLKVVNNIPTIGL